MKSKVTTRRRKTVKVRLAGDPILTTVCYSVLPGEDVSHITRDMMNIITNNPRCVGISANQVGYDKRIVIVRTGPKSTLALINPIIRCESEDDDMLIEGCLSYHGKQKEISRPVGIKLDYEDISGKLKYDVEFHGFVARIIQHEIDHLNGKCKVDVIG